jgi:hypothetical protein
MAHTGGNLGTVDLTSVTLTSYVNQENFFVGSFSFDNLVVDDGTTLYRVKQIIGFLGVFLDSMTTQGMSFNFGNDSPDNLLVYNGALAMTLTATVPGILLPVGGSFALTTYFGVLGQPGSAQPVVQCQGIVYFTCFDGSIIDPSSIGSTVGTTVQESYDSSCPQVTFPGVLGTFSPFRIDLAQWALPSDFVAADLGSLAGEAMQGQMNFTPDLCPPAGSPVWWNGSRWVGPSLFGEAIGQAPGAAPLAGLGATGTATLEAGSNDTAGVVTLTPGGAGIAAGNQAEVSFTTALGNAPRAVVLFQANLNAAVLQGANAGGLYVAHVTGGGFELASGTALTGGDPYVFSYVVVP